MKPTILFPWLRPFALAAALLCAACETGAGIDGKRPGDPVLFGASVRESGEVRTRGVEGLDSVYITSDKYNVDF